MRVISKARLRQFWDLPGHDDSEGSLRAWYTHVNDKTTAWQSWSDVRADFASASIVGNCVVFKPAELVPGSAWALAEIVSRSGLPAGVFNLVMGRGSVVGEALLASPDVAAISSDRNWKTFLFCGYGVKSEEAARLCPDTWRILQRIPGLTSAMFSIFEPGKHLPPHRGPYNGVLRLHLGLIVPEPREQLGIRVENETYRWKEGEAVIFDDAYEHEAWNKTDKTRVVLFVDFVKPLRFPANLLNRLLLSLAIFTPFIREGMDNQKAWERKFYAEAEALRNR